MLGLAEQHKMKSCVVILGTNSPVSEGKWAWFYLRMFCGLLRAENSKYLVFGVFANSHTYLFLLWMARISFIYLMKMPEPLNFHLPNFLCLHLRQMDDLENSR